MLAQNPRKVNLNANDMGSGTANRYIPIAALNNASMPTKLMKFMISITEIYIYPLSATNRRLDLFNIQALFLMPFL